ncbi:hypothetical protein K491DRAFT_680597 [Lophiostoma macrostomum CBS 122681]|uniref:Extracellular membrane protein CFEM domain-containing protein n=1 Tax=Lophiostoma macrostomum CBS 122681 TaxID=1314788 RepID=A0A6A6T0C5_9PLEO|nr:hypothetical protein K491DRAFT_680597 [Lophiostoma macrostomum CBS 122681]
MLSKTLFLALAAVASIASAASPPACLLGAVNNYDDVSDIAGICKEKDASKQIAKVCGDKASVALSAFADVCNKVGVEVWKGGGLEGGGDGRDGGGGMGWEEEGGDD